MSSLFSVYTVFSVQGSKVACLQLNGILGTGSGLEGSCWNQGSTLLQNCYLVLAQSCCGLKMEEECYHTF